MPPLKPSATVEPSCRRSSLPDPWSSAWWTDQQCPQWSAQSRLSQKPPLISMEAAGSPARSFSSAVLVSSKICFSSCRWCSSSVRSYRRMITGPSSVKEVGSLRSSPASWGPASRQCPGCWTRLIHLTWSPLHGSYSSDGSAASAGWRERQSHQQSGSGRPPLHRHPAHRCPSRQTPSAAGPGMAPRRRQWGRHPSLAPWFRELQSARVPPAVPRPQTPKDSSLMPFRHQTHPWRTECSGAGHAPGRLRWEVADPWGGSPSHRSPNWNQNLLHFLPLRIILWLRIGQRFLAALLHLGDLDQGLARTQPEKMIAESSRFGIEPDGLETVVLRVLHVLPIVPGCALDERSGVQDTKTSLAKCLSFSNHLAVKVRMKSIASTIPRHHKDDVPNVGSGGQLRRSTLWNECSRVLRSCCWPRHDAFGSSMPSPHLTTHIERTRNCQEYRFLRKKRPQWPGVRFPSCRLSRECSIPLIISGRPRPHQASA